MYELKVISEFNAAHHLRDYKGECEKLHGHNWRVEAIGVGKELGKDGLVVDFRVFKQALEVVLKKLDHCLINEVKPFDSVNPSSENIAKYIFQILEKSSDLKGKLKIKAVSVWETSTSCATYSESNA